MESPPLTVLHVFGFFAPDFTGEGIYATKMFAHLQALGIANEVLVKRSHPRVAGLRSQRVADPVPHTIHYLPPRRSRCLPELQIAWWVLRYGRRFAVVHYHAHCDRRLLSLLIARLLGLRVVMSCTLDDSPRAMLESYRPAFRWLVKRLLRLVHIFISISPKLHADHGDIVGEQRHLLIPQGVDLPADPQRDRARLRAGAGLGDGDLGLVFIGALCERKDPMFLVEQMPNVLAGNARARLFIVGPTTEDAYAERLVARARQLGLTDHVRFVGFAERPADWYAAADVLVFSSTNEGFGNVLLEAMAHGLPVVSRRLPGVTDSFIAHGETGMLFDDPDGYQRALAELADPGRRQRLGAAARQVAAERFALDQVAKRYAAVYRGS